MAKRVERVETDAERVDRWIKGAVEPSGDIASAVRAQWVAGCTLYVTVDGVNYECFSLSDLTGLDLTGYVVIEWDWHGNVCIL